MDSGNDSTTAWVLRGFRCKHTPVIESDLGVSMLEARSILQALRDRFRRRYLLAGVVALVVFAVGVVLQTLVIRLLMFLGFDPIESIGRVLDGTALADPAFFFVLAIFYVVIPAWLAKLVSDHVDERPFRRELRRCVDEPACFSCGHSMVGLDKYKQLICPECGHTTPPRTKSQSES